jgi:hypothetical protein
LFKFIPWLETIYAADNIKALQVTTQILLLFYRVNVNKYWSARWPVFLQLGVAQFVEQIILASVRQKSLGVLLRAVCIPYSAEALGGSPNLSPCSGARTAFPAEWFRPQTGKKIEICQHQIHLLTEFIKNLSPKNQPQKLQRNALKVIVKKCYPNNTSYTVNWKKSWC